MKRIPEPDLMDSVEQAEAYAATDFSEPHNAFVQYFKYRFPDFSEGRVLDLGCGTADVIIRFAGEFQRSHITGMDGAREMLDIGINDITSRGLTERITLKQCLLPHHDIYAGQFDAIISNSLLHHLLDPMVLWDTIKQYRRERSPVFIMDLYRPDTSETARSLVNEYAADAPDLLKKDFYNSLLASYNKNEIQDQLTQSGLGHFKVETVTDRHIIIWGQK